MWFVGSATSLTSSLFYISFFSSTILFCYSHSVPKPLSALVSFSLHSIRIVNNRKELGFVNFGYNWKDNVYIYFGKCVSVLITNAHGVGGKGAIPNSILMLSLFIAGSPNLLDQWPLHRILDPSSPPTSRDQYQPHRKPLVWSVCLCPCVYPLFPTLDNRYWCVYIHVT